MSKNFRSALRKSRNKLAREPDLEFVRARTVQDVPDAFAQFLAVESSGWKGARGSAIAADQRLTGFYRSLSERFTALDCFEINLLRVSGRCIAAQFCMRVDRTLSILKIGYDERYAQLAPGNMLLEHVLRRCNAERDIDVVDLASDASWHASWNPKSEQHLSVMVFNDTVRGRMAHALAQGKEHLRPFYRKYVRPHFRRAEGGAQKA
jgi:CelD/BcsL family acetyltransferase involved in cellulose biosynthesis